MRTLDELLYYCEEPEPVGAILLTGEWGCGKTYLIDNDLKDALENKAHIIRISLFGIASIEGIHMAVKQAWISEYNKGKNWDAVAKKVQKGKEIAGKLDFLPEWFRGIATTDWFSFVEIKNMIEEKPVILVFDDLERCCLETVDILGAINEYCENQKFHTIIIANQEKMRGSKQITAVPVEVEIDTVKNEDDNVFDVEMAIITAEAYAKGNNFDKHQFSYYFNKMWKGNIISPDIRVEESLVGFRKLQELLKEQKENLQKNEKVFAVKHTEEFIKYLNEIIEKLNGNLLQAE